MCLQCKRPWVRSLGPKDPLKGMAASPVFLPGESMRPKEPAMPEKLTLSLPHNVNFCFSFKFQHNFQTKCCDILQKTQSLLVLKTSIVSPLDNFPNLWNSHFCLNITDALLCHLNLNFKSGLILYQAKYQVSSLTPKSNIIWRGKKNLQINPIWLNSARQRGAMNFLDAFHSCDNCCCFISKSPLPLSYRKGCLLH